VRTHRTDFEWHEGELLQVSSFDNYVWRTYENGIFSSKEYETLSFPEVVLPLGEREKNTRGDVYLRVLSTVGVVWIGQWCLWLAKREGDLNE
jgi:hypothetical protein